MRGMCVVLPDLDGCCVALADAQTTEARNSAVCGIRRSSIPDLFSRIVGGAPAENHEFPWQVSLQWRYNWYTYHVCGGAVLDQNWVITAAHCTHQFEPKDLAVVAGDHALKAKEGSEQTRYVEKIVEHSGYNSNTQQHDLALLKLSSPLILDGLTVSPICLPSYRNGFSGYCVVAGWGKLSENGDTSDILRKVVVPVISDSRCQRSYRDIGYTGPITSSMICAGYSTGGKDACQGDSGGPFVCRGPDNRYHLAGIVSWGIGCARANVPGVYTEVSYYVDWISNVINNRISIPIRPASRVAITSLHNQEQGATDQVTEDQQNREETVLEQQQNTLPPSQEQTSFYQQQEPTADPQEQTSFDQQQEPITDPQEQSSFQEQHELTEDPQEQSSFQEQHELTEDPLHPILF
ncbi:hypothetical protein Pcinc_032229 [Petrolisthes cinctipes]|uniref:Peptidase S1 domain-containing protein n=1 Tax=Petrolisthes cinctipes TaxID=88211 RepID=A0AAE1EUS1_PETCI|nr:hypothetical protein Pcinc_032229 [Petrolisthes cinctipes]